MIEITLEKAFLALPGTEREAIIRYGAVLRLSGLERQLALAEQKVHRLEAKYRTTLPRLETAGLPDDAGYEMHEDYVMWRHWEKTASTLRQDLLAVQAVVQQTVRELSHAGD